PGEEILQLLIAGMLPRAEDDVRDRHPTLVRIGNAEGAGFRNGGMTVERLLDLARGGVLPVALGGLAGPSRGPAAPLRVLQAHVAGPQPAVDEHLVVSLGPVPVAR